VATAADGPALTPTFTFHGSSYTSKYLSFASAEETTNYREGNSTSSSVLCSPRDADRGPAGTAREVRRRGERRGNRRSSASANYLTAAICKLTRNQPAAACTPAVKAIEAKL
jgi:hypothetical protein